MKKILLIATGGTIASTTGKSGLSPTLSAEELLKYVPEIGGFCKTDCIQPFNIDSTNVAPAHWLTLSDLICDNYDKYDGFVICHGTDTMAYTAAALSYLIQNSKKPVVLTGAQKPIDKEDTDARVNLRDAFAYAASEKAAQVTIAFHGKIIAGTRAKKIRTKSFNAFESVDFPVLGTVRGGGGPLSQHEWLLWRLADHLMCNSTPLFTVLRELGVPEDRLTYIANGVDTDRYAPGPVPLEERAPLVLSVGRLVEN
ncbi:MAG: asparaginase domain-containing protein, partial [Candidatus Scatosoma sp.]